MRIEENSLNPIAAVRDTLCALLSAYVEAKSCFKIDVMVLFIIFIS